jgi:hypothetical protein
VEYTNRCDRHRGTKNNAHPIGVEKTRYETARTNTTQWASVG